MSNPKQYVLNDSDVLFFYYHSAKTDAEIAKRESISKIASRHGIKFDFIKDKCTRQQATQNCIKIYKSKTNHNRTFFKHLRNAFAHLYIEISGNRCKLLDWNPYASGTQSKFKVSLITMTVDVEYEALKKVLEEFFSPTQEQNENNNQTNNADVGTPDINPKSCL